MSESGLIQHWKQIHWPDIKKCKHAQRIQMRTNREPKKLSLKDLQGSFFIWSTGFILALVAFLTELISARITHWSFSFCSRKVLTIIG